MAVSFTPLQPTLGIALGELRLVCGGAAMEIHFMKLPTNSSCADFASRGNLELCSECCDRGQTNRLSSVATLTTKLQASALGYPVL